MPETYNGSWPNKITWSMFTWITDTGGMVEGGSRVSARHNASILRSFIEGFLNLDDLKPYTLETVLLTHALDMVDWGYLAEKLREE